LKERERGNREEGAQWGKEERAGVRAKRPSSSPPSIQNRGGGVEAGRVLPVGGDCRRARPRRRSGSREKRRGLHGKSIPLPTFGGGGAQRWIPWAAAD
jgi:hypothetical protein